MMPRKNKSLALAVSDDAMLTTFLLYLLSQMMSTTKFIPGKLIWIQLGSLKTDATENEKHSRSPVRVMH